jgi:hypothetical protein
LVSSRGEREKSRRQPDAANTRREHDRQC